MKKKIIKARNKLHQPSKEIDVKKDMIELLKIVQDMRDTIKDTDGVGLSAIQIGYDKRVFLIRFEDKMAVFVNPIVNKASGLYIAVEGCLSESNRRYVVPRYKQIEVFYQTVEGKYHSVKMQGNIAQIFQHEYDHLSGVLISDLGLSYNKEMEKLSEEELMSLFKEAVEKAEKNKQKDEKGKNTNGE